MRCVLLSAYVTKRHSNGVFLTILRGLKKSVQLSNRFSIWASSFHSHLSNEQGIMQAKFESYMYLSQGQAGIQVYCKPCLLFDLQVGTLRPFQSNIPQAVRNTACKMNV